MQNLGLQLNAGQVLDFPPIADDHEFKTDFETGMVLVPVTNAIAYNGATLDLTTIDLDPDTDGQQSSYTSIGGTFALQGDGSILFTPALEFAGKTAARYTIADSNGRVSNAAQIRVMVNPVAGAPYNLFSFETGTEGWDAGMWQSSIGTVSVSTEWFADGAQSLQINTTGGDGGWFGVIMTPAQNWTGRTKLVYQLKTLEQPTSVAGVVKVGNAYLWCQSDFAFVPANSVSTVEVDLTKMSGGAPDLSKVQEMYLFFSGGGTYYLDAIQIQ